MFFVVGVVIGIGKGVIMGVLFIYEVGYWRCKEFLKVFVRFLLWL